MPNQSNIVQINSDDLRALVIALSAVEYRMSHPAYESRDEMRKTHEDVRDSHQLAQDLLHRGRPERPGAVRIARLSR